MAARLQRVAEALAQWRTTQSRMYEQNAFVEVGKLLRLTYGGGKQADPVKMHGDEGKQAAWAHVARGACRRIQGTWLVLAKEVAGCKQEVKAGPEDGGQG